MSFPVATLLLLRLGDKETPSLYISFSTSPTVFPEIPPPQKKN